MEPRPDDLRLARCPVCRLALPDDPAACRRCESDLTLVRAAYDGAWADVQAARLAHALGDPDAAYAAAWRAASLARTETTLETLASLTR